MTILPKLRADLVSHQQIDSDNNKIIVIKRDEITGDGAPAAAPVAAAPPAAPRAPQRTRERRPDQRRKQEKTSLESYTQAENATKAAPAPPARQENMVAAVPTDAAKTGQPRKKHRSRKHGNRNKPGSTPDSGTPTPSSGA